MVDVIQQRQMLLVIKDLDMIELINSIFKTNNLIAHLFMDPLLALEKFRKNSTSISLVMYDISIKSMSAFAFLREVRTLNLDTQFVLITPIAIKPTEFSLMMPQIKVDGFIDKASLQKTMIPMLNKLLAIHKENTTTGKSN